MTIDNLPKRPMLSATAEDADLLKLTYPILASPKLDGIRCLIHPEKGPLTRSFISVPNEHIRRVLDRSWYYGLDGELMCVDGKGNPLDFTSIQSAVMSRGGQPDFEYWVFDWFLIDGPYETRYAQLCEKHTRQYDLIVKPLPHTLLHNPSDARVYAAEQLAQGYEGVVFRAPNGVYKSGRSTLKQQGMVKFKQFFDAEGVVTDFEELLHNKNEKERDEFGLAERSSKKEGMVPGDTLGALILTTSWGDLRVGTGFDMWLRDEIWQNKGKYIGRLVTFKYQKYGMQDLPRFPVFLRFRED